MNKICKECHIEFVTKWNLQKYCSKKCSIIGRMKTNRIHNKKYWNEHKEERKLYMKIYRQEHKQQIQNTARIYSKIHLAHRRKLTLQKLKTDICFKLSMYLRHRIYMALKNNQKSGYTLELLGCSIEQLKRHLESQFKLGMSWKNYGKNGWEVDHIKPCASFDLSKSKEQLECFNYKNLQPLWQFENGSKHDKILTKGGQSV